MKRKEAKFLDDYVVIDSLRKKRKSGVRKQKRSKKMIKSEDGQSQEVVNNFDEEGLAEEQGEFKQLLFCHFCCVQLLLFQEFRYCHVFFLKISKIIDKVCYLLYQFSTNYLNPSSLKNFY
jgi:hypothetical protein